MIGLIVTGHGHFASGLTSSLDLIAGPQEHYNFVDFEQDMSVEDLEKDLLKAFEDLKECEGILVLSDLAGGSPFKTAVEIGHPKGNTVVIAGANLPMLTEISLARKFVEPLEDLASMAINTGKEQIVRYEFKKVVQDEQEDGI